MTALPRKSLHSNDRSAHAGGASTYVFALIILVYFYFVRYSYVDVIAYSALFKYSGAISLEPVQFAPTVSAGISLIPLLWLRTTLIKPSDQLIFYSYAFVFVPACALMPYLTDLSFFDQVYFLSLMIIFLSSSELRRLIPEGAFGDFAIKSSATYITLLGASSFVCCLMLFFIGEITVENLLTFDVYERRSVLLSDGGGASAVLFYIANWSALALAPCAIVVGLARRNYLIATLGFTLSLFAFAATSFKSHLFIPMLSAIAYVMLSRLKVRHMGLSLLVIFLGISVVALIIDTYVNYAPFLTWAFQFRMIGNNGFLAAEYFEFFSDMPKGLFADSIGSILFEPVYNKPIAQLVGESFSSVTGNHANASYLADGYANGGLFGMAFAAAEFLLFVWIVDSVGSGKDVRVVAALLIPAAFNFANTSVHSTLTSNGGLLLLLLLLAMPRQGDGLSSKEATAPPPGDRFGRRDSGRTAPLI